MTSKRYQLEEYKRYLLNRSTASSEIFDYMESRAASEDENIKHTFHKVMVHNCTGNDVQLFDTMADYFASLVIPVHCMAQGDIYTFYTSSLSFIMKIIKFDFMFPFRRTMFNLDILFNDKSSVDLFENSVTVEDIINGVVHRRFSEKFELDLSDFSNDQEFLDKKIHFYKLSLLAHFKILMIRMGRDTKILNLSNNNLSQAPMDILNFFIKGDLTAINLSYNNIPSLNELLRMTSRIEKLWLEGNPLCEELDSVSYVKNVTMKFPRLIELDGVKLNQYGMGLPFFRNYLTTPDRRTKMLVEKFVILYFSYYDSPSFRTKIETFYGDNAVVTVSTNFPDHQAKLMPYYINHSRNMMNRDMKSLLKGNKRMYRKPVFGAVFGSFPHTIHDLSTFNVDVLLHDKKSLILVIEGIYKQLASTHSHEGYFYFRRTFIFDIYVINDNSVYHISNEMFYLTMATEEQISSSFKTPIRNMNALSLMSPDNEDCESICKAFQHITQLKKSEAELRLKYYNWDIKEAIKKIVTDLKLNKIPTDRFIDEDDFSDTSSLLDEVD